MVVLVLITTFCQPEKGWNEKQIAFNLVGDLVNLIGIITAFNVIL